MHIKIVHILSIQPLKELLFYWQGHFAARGQFYAAYEYNQLT